MARSLPRRALNRRGVALLVVLLLVMLLSIIVWSFQRDVLREVLVASNVRDDLKAAYQAQMALVRGQAILRLDDKPDYDSLNEPWAQPTNWKGETFGNEDSSETTAGRPPAIFITDEERKFNLLTLIRGSEAQRKAAAETLSRLIEICRRNDERLMLDGESRSVRRRNDDREVNTETLVKNLIKYLEERAREDSDKLEFTARENDKPDSRSIKKQSPFPMLTLGELRMIEGWSGKLLHGEPREVEGGSEEDSRDYYDLNYQEQFEARKKSVESIDERSMDPQPIGILPFLTLYSTGVININTAPRELLLALNKDLTWDAVDRIITAREQARRDIETAEENGGTLPEEEAAPTNPDGTPAEEEDKASFRTQDLATFKAFVTRITGEENGAVEGLTEEIFNAIKPLLTVRSRVFMIEAQGYSGKISKTFRAIYRRQGSNAQQPAGTSGGTTGGTPGGTSGGTSGGTTGGTTGGTSGGASGGPTIDNGLPPETKITLTLLLLDEVEGR